MDSSISSYSAFNVSYAVFFSCTSFCFVTISGLDVNSLNSSPVIYQSLYAFQIGVLSIISCVAFSVTFVVSTGTLFNQFNVLALSSFILTSGSRLKSLYVCVR